MPGEFETLLGGLEVGRPLPSEISCGESKQRTLRALASYVFQFVDYLGQRVDLDREIKPDVFSSELERFVCISRADCRVLGMRADVELLDALNSAAVFETINRRVLEGEQSRAPITGNDGIELLVQRQVRRMQSVAIAADLASVADGTKDMYVNN